MSKRRKGINMINYVFTDNKGRNTFKTEDFLTSKRVIMLKGEINNDTALNIVENILLMSEESSKDITICINSPGGSIDAGLLILDAMQGSRCDIRTVCLGECYSMGAFLLAAGTKGKRYISAHGRTMIHEPQLSSGLAGNCTSIEEISKSMLNTKNMINNMLAAFCGKNLQDIDNATKNKDCFMNAENAKQFGLVDHVCENNLISAIIGEVHNKYD